MSSNKTQVTVSLFSEQVEYLDSIASAQYISRGQAVRQIIKEMMATGVPTNLSLNERVTYLENERNKLFNSIRDLDYQITTIKGQLDA
jgi:metal-responsive CopG/Arc/MetJ family transcriptional regulator